MNRSDAERDRGRGGEGTRRQRREAYFLRPGRRVFPAPCPPIPPSLPPLFLSLWFTLFFTGCGMLSSTAPASTAAPVIPPATALAANADASEAAIRWLEDRVRKDPDDFIAHNKLADYYLQRLRETGNVRWLELAARTARASLKAIPAEQNPGGLVLLGQTEFASHNFAASRDVANQLISSGLPEKGDRSYPWQLLGDSLLELGDYEGAEKAYDRVRKFGAGGAGVETRLAHYETLRGNIEKAERHYAEALSAALNQVPPSRETVAWIRWQLGELAFAAGDYEAAEKNYRDSLTTFPDYFRALAGL